VSLYENGLMDRKEVIVGDGDVVFVIGCGNTAIDAARTAIRMGSKEVNVVYHRTINEMKALRAEYDDAVAEGVKFLWNTSITNIEALDDTAIKTVTLTTDGEDRVVPADHVIMAVGSAPASRIVSTTEGIEVDGNGYVITRDTPYGMTTRKGVFAGGDVTNRPATVVHAMHDAKLVAEGIEKYVDAVKLLDIIDRQGGQA
ncbi:MAG: FAD-dependent oxidoreductase, partial [Muribaculaceae bacterium]|nr:FAD-dependent oxidoreductase [Muribaculaceae bacterium]MDE6771533.1 FAD-dependent oxidoreductase [Muribaculaceae bacterium]